MLVCLCVLSSLACWQFFRICRGTNQFLRLRLGLMCCVKFCMGYFVFWLRGLIVCVLLPRVRRRRLGGLCFFLLLVLGFLLILLVGG